MSPDPIAVLGAHFESLDVRTSDRFDRELQIQLNDAYRAPALHVDLRSLRPNAALLFAFSIVAGSMGFSIASTPKGEDPEAPITRAEILSVNGE